MTSKSPSDHLEAIQQSLEDDLLKIDDAALLEETSSAETRVADVKGIFAKAVEKVSLHSTNAVGMSRRKRAPYRGSSKGTVRATTTDRTWARLRAVFGWRDLDEGDNSDEDGPS